MNQNKKDIIPLIRIAMIIFGIICLIGALGVYVLPSLFSGPGNAGEPLLAAFLILISFPFFVFGLAATIITGIIYIVAIIKRKKKN